MRLRCGSTSSAPSMARSMWSISLSVVIGIPYSWASSEDWNEVGTPTMSCTSPARQRRPNSWIISAAVDPGTEAEDHSGLDPPGRFRGHRSSFIRCCTSTPGTMGAQPWRWCIRWRIGQQPWGRMDSMPGQNLTRDEAARRAEIITDVAYQRRPRPDGHRRHVPVAYDRDLPLHRCRFDHLAGPDRSWRAFDHPGTAANSIPPRTSVDSVSTFRTSIPATPSRWSPTART